MFIEHTKHKLGLIVLWQWALGIGQSNNGSLWRVMELLAGGCVWGAIILARSPLYPIFILPVLLLININLERSVVSDKKGRIFGSTWQEFGISAAHFCLSYLSSFNLIFWSRFVIYSFLFTFYLIYFYIFVWFILIFSFLSDLLSYPFLWYILTNKSGDRETLRWNGRSC